MSYIKINLSSTFLTPNDRTMLDTERHTHAYLVFQIVPMFFISLVVMRFQPVLVIADHPRQLSNEDISPRIWILKHVKMIMQITMFNVKFVAIR